MTHRTDYKSSGAHVPQRASQRSKFWSRQGSFPGPPARGVSDRRVSRDFRPLDLGLPGFQVATGGLADSRVTSGNPAANPSR
jgi:hypothetical protein